MNITNETHFKSIVQLEVPGKYYKELTEVMYIGVQSSCNNKPSLLSGATAGMTKRAVPLSSALHSL